MRIGALHFYSADNIGDAAIYAALQALSPGAQWVKAGPQTPLCDAYVSVGGDIFNNGRPGLITRRFLSKLKAFDEAPERTVVFGQSIPPSCDGFALRLLARRLRRIAGVCVRDEKSVAKLAARGVSARLGVDSAFALTPSPEDREAALAAFAAQGLDPEETALLSIRGFNRMYPLNEEAFLSRMAIMANRLAREGLRPALLIQSRVNEADSDAAGAAYLRRECPSLVVIDPFAPDAQVAPWRLAFGALSEAATVVGARYHTAVLRMAAGRAAYMLWYSNKGEDLARRFALPGAAADVFDPEAAAQTVAGMAGVRFNAAPLRAQAQRDFDAMLALATAYRS